MPCKAVISSLPAYHPTLDDCFLNFVWVAVAACPAAILLFLILLWGVSGSLIYVKPHLGVRSQFFRKYSIIILVSLKEKANILKNRSERERDGVLTG